jgi:hypothetical protein
VILLAAYRRLPANARAKYLRNVPHHELRMWPQRLKVMIALGEQRGEPQAHLEPIRDMLADVERALHWIRA